ncbi:glycosyltransferase family 4 protein [Calycina marina]|uniref:Glycosyltransferase family 4 protein n=1 Tax=Calycina marina TaxID=1763456 RepID=A0A9P8CKQ3_9HELO|nr:glycosyltransferase family 4 protein [Calycina marina]
MAHIHITGVKAGSWHELLQSWWQFILVGFILISISLGLIYIAAVLTRSAYRRYRTSRSNGPKVSATIKNQIEHATIELSQYAVERNNSKPTSFGVYLGEFSDPPTEAQIQVLSKWDILVVDTDQPGVAAILRCGLYPVSPHILARLDIGLVSAKATRSPISVVLEWLSILLTSSASDGEKSSAINGVLLSNWDKTISTGLLKEVIRASDALNLSVYLEVRAPEYLANPSLAELEEVTGIIIRNGTISSSGEEQDAFQMCEMRSTIKAFVLQACLRQFVVLVWETLDEDAKPLNAVVKRCYNWCRFYSALPWIGRSSSLVSAELSLEQKEPLGAFDWLKEQKVMTVHNKWRASVAIQPNYQASVSDHLCELYDLLSVESFNPNDTDLFPLQNATTAGIPRLGTPNSLVPQFDHLDASTPMSGMSTVNLLDSHTDLGYVNWLSAMDRCDGNVISHPIQGSSYDCLGCFPLGSVVSRQSFKDVAQSQQRLKDMRLLDTMKHADLNIIGEMLNRYCADLATRDVSYVSEWLVAIQELSEQLCSATSDGMGPISVHIGLDSGFQIHPGSRFWAVYSIEEDGATDIYMSRNVEDTAATILHTFLSSRGCPRHECIQAEISLSEWGCTVELTSQLSPRILRDITLLSPAETLRFLHSLCLSLEAADPALINKLRLACNQHLLSATDFKQLKNVVTVDYLSGRVEASEIIEARMIWYAQSGCQYPGEIPALEHFEQVQISVQQLLKNRDIEKLQDVTEKLSQIIRDGDIDARVDLAALSVFCAMRKHAFDEAYMEVTDRNTLFNDQSDQAAAFAELFATGARCEAYFDVTPSAFGKLLSDRYRSYHHQPGHEPPIWTDENPTTPSAYAAAKIDIDTASVKSSMSSPAKFTFLSVFAIPALLDILLLTTIGKGLYLSGNYTGPQIHAATLALMISLLISGTVGTWITCGGSYYLISMAFSAMNMFVITRLLAGLAFTLIAAAIGFIILCATDSWASGVIFALYLLALTAYLCILAALANYQYPGSTFQAGRPIIIMAIPILFISPLITIFFPGYDIFVYLIVIYVFLTVLILGLRRTGAKWITWYLTIERVSDQELRKWFVQTQLDGDEDSLKGLTDPGVLKLARAALLQDINKVRSRFRKVNTTDPIVQKLAQSYEATEFLMEWYSGYSGTPMPIPFSSTWNMQTKVALQTLRQLQTGIRLHNAFIHWRQAGDEVGCSLLYFIVALMDKWNSLLSGGKLLGLTTQDEGTRMSVGFALAYYLIGSVLLDVNATKLHQLVGRGQNTLIGNVSSISGAVKNEILGRRILYWTMLGRYVLFHVWSLAFSSSLMWVFASSRTSTLMFLSYIGAYSGLLWFQYTKIFAGPRSLKPLVVAVLVGVPLGQLLRHFFPEWAYCDVVGLAAATWTAAFLSLYYARIKLRAKDGISRFQALSKPYSLLKPDEDYHYFSAVENDSLFSQDELSTIYNNLCSLSNEQRYRLESDKGPGAQVKATIAKAIDNFKGPDDLNSCFAVEAFPNALEVLEHVLSAFESGAIIVECVTLEAITVPNPQAVSYVHNNCIRLIVVCELIEGSQQHSYDAFCQRTAEMILHSVLEIYLDFTHDDAFLAETLIGLSRGTEYPVSQQVKSHISPSSSSTQLHSFVRYCEKQSIRHIALGYDVDIDWEKLPRDIRDFVVGRCTGEEEHTLAKKHQDWLAFDRSLDIPFETYIARCNFGAFVALANRRYALAARSALSMEDLRQSKILDGSLDFLTTKRAVSKLTLGKLFRKLKRPFSTIYHNIGIVLKLLALAFVAEPELARELDYALSTSNRFIRDTVMFFITHIWIYTRVIQSVLLPVFVLHGRNNVKTLLRHVGGATVTLRKKQRVSIESNAGSSTAFIHTSYGDSGTYKVYQYAGVLAREPVEKTKLQRVSTYNRNRNLLNREDYQNGTKVNIYKYEYAAATDKASKRLSKTKASRYPLKRRCIEGKDELEEHVYNRQGLVERGSYILHGNLIRFSCHYRQPSNFEDELLRAEFVLPHLTCTVAWSTPPKNHVEKPDQWIASSQVMEATFVLGSDVYESRWIYDHKFHPTIVTKLNGEPIDTPPIIQWDHLGVLKKPTKFNYLDDDPFLDFNSLRSGPIKRMLGLNTRRNPVSTSQARSRLWRAWKETPGFDGVIVRWLDERLLRKEPLMRTYWRNRDRGNLKAAEGFLNQSAERIMATVDLDNSISGWTPLAMKIADFYSFGQGGDANSRTRSKEPDFDDGGLQVLAVDSGTWPNEGGGVSACRRDMINNLRSVHWHMIAESANDSGLPKHQTEMNVRSLKVIPLWGLDFQTPTHGLFRDRLDTEVEHVPRDATKMDVKRNFLPILKALVKGARTSDYTQADIRQMTRALVNLNTYFSKSKHWGAVWTSRVVKDAWRSFWIAEDLVSPTPSEGWFHTEIPTIAQLDGALELWFRYLFIFSIPLPERIPAIFQASHHSVSASYGIVCKIKRGSTLQIWDHAISWRETNLYLSSDLCSMAPFVRNALLGLMKISSRLVLHHADTILPCADFFNPGWEVEIGTSQGRLAHRNIFKRKIDPVVNGIPDMTKFAPINTITSKLPTVTMLSHVWYAKDIKTAILAADIIVNEWGFRDYRLDIYGAIDKAPSYSTDCFEIVASKSLPRYVTMCGEANPTTVLEKTWVFLNSSISEGLPLALGEAALTGAPVVCTDVGASLRVLTDPDTGECYSSVVAPNDARNLARAQINFLAMLDNWAPYADDTPDSVVPKLTDKPTPEDIALITARMYAKVEQRKALGMKSREIVQKSFGGERYLREHEQMLWIGKARYDLLHRHPKPSAHHPRVESTSALIPSHMWGETERYEESKRKRILSSVQTSTLMVNSVQPSVFSNDGIKSLFESRNTSSKVSTALPTSVQGTPTLAKKKGGLMPPRVVFLKKETEESGRSSTTARYLPGEESFLYDITSALERV